MRGLSRRFCTLVTLTIVGCMVLVPPARASSGTLRVTPSVLHPGQTVTFCGSGFAYENSDKVVSSSIDGLVGTHAGVRPDGTACASYAYEDFRAPAARYAKLFLSSTSASGSGLRTDYGRVYLASSTLPFTGPGQLVWLLTFGTLALVAGLATLAIERHLVHR
ncbi:MAG: hypothetical protein JF597_03120 [Streptomyces sp.]|uniref:hypothetical protein n=1 Tax=Streptomyces sp. TaxID=1931 RepID=UPI0025DFB5F9|nr:hypothetical protein [Streptomyces sp.]MBW8792603.1 hypothetical protein [Streptomyces sp.]